MHHRREAVIAENTSADVLDVSGRLLEHRDLSPRVGENSIYLTARALTTGMYWVRVRQAGHEVLARAVKLD